MPAINFQKQFADAVENGTKLQTIRLPRKDGRDPKPGDTLYLYTGMRTKVCRKLGEGRCFQVEEVVIDRNSIRLFGHTYLLDDGRRNFAKADGFESFEKMLTWFDEVHGLPFNGLVIRWEQCLADDHHELPERREAARQQEKTA